MEQPGQCLWFAGAGGFLISQIELRKISTAKLPKDNVYERRNHVSQGVVPGI